MAYEIWETSSRNLIADFLTEEEALQAVREALTTRGEQYLSTWLLAYEDGNEDTSTLAAGEALVELARSAGA